MKKVLAALGLLFGFVALSHAGTPQENLYNGQAPLSNATILASTASVVPGATLTLVISTPTAQNSGGSTYNGRNCITRFVVQVSTYSAITIADNLTTKWTLYGNGLGASGVNTLSLPEDHLGPWCTAAGDQMVITLTPSASPTSGIAGQSQAINVEGYTTYGGTNNSGPMY